MFNRRSVHRMPRAGVDPIDSEPVALCVLDMVVSRPLRHETIVLFLDEQRRGITFMVVSGTIPFDSLFDVIDVIVDQRRRVRRTRCGRSVHRPSAGARGRRSRRTGRRPLARGQCDARRCRHRAARVVRGRRIDHVTARSPGRATALDGFRGRPGVGADGVTGPDECDRLLSSMCRYDGQGVVRARRSAGDSRSPPARSRRTSSRLSTSDAPSAISPARYSSGMS